jgi:hypothetical protein
MTAEADRVAVEVLTDSSIRDGDGNERPYGDTAYGLGEFPDLYRRRG